MICKTGFTKSGDYCLKYSSPAREYSVNVATCAALGGYLAKVDTSEKAAIVYSYLQGKCYQYIGSISIQLIQVSLLTQSGKQVN